MAVNEDLLIYIQDRAELAKWAQKALDAAIRGKN